MNNRRKLWYEKIIEKAKLSIQKEEDQRIFAALEQALGDLDGLLVYSFDDIEDLMEVE